MQPEAKNVTLSKGNVDQRCWEPLTPPLALLISSEIKETSVAAFRKLQRIIAVSAAKELSLLPFQETATWKPTWKPKFVFASRTLDIHGRNYLG